MQTQKMLKLDNKLKKSHILLIGSLLVFFGILFLSWNYLLRMRDEVYSDMKIAMMDDSGIEIPAIEADVIPDTPVAQDINDNSHEEEYVVDYSKYLGVLEIPKIGLKRGFYNTDSKYNNIRYNVAMVQGSNLPDVANGNLILMAHSGNSYISYFANLYKLDIGDNVYVTYAGRKYNYQIVNIYQVAKTGMVMINRNYDKTSLTMITCTKDSNDTQTIYISELVG